MTKQRQQTPKENLIYYLPEDVEQLEDHYLNRDSCYSQDDFVNKQCHECVQVKMCIYKDKYKYRKIEQ